MGYGKSTIRNVKYIKKYIFSLSNDRTNKSTRLTGLASRVMGMVQVRRNSQVERPLPTREALRRLGMVLQRRHHQMESISS
jgi:hypothetical protein